MHDDDCGPVPTADHSRDDHSRDDHDQTDPHGFDGRAATWDDDPAKVERAGVVADVIAQTVPLDTSTRMLEYGAGTGLVTQALRDRVGPVTLADTSAGMRAVMDEKIASGLITDARVWDIDLATAAPPDEQFDLVVTVMVLHHIADLAPVLANISAALAPGGHLAIVDLEQEDGTFHGDGFGGHHGFERAALAARLGAAGFGDIAFRHCYDVLRDGGRYPLFLATGRAVR